MRYKRCYEEWLRRFVVLLWWLASLLGKRLLARYGPLYCPGDEREDA